MEGLGPRPRDAGRRRQVRARQFRERQVRVCGHDVDVLPSRRQVLRQHRRPRTASSPTTRSSTRSVCARCSNTWSKCPVAACRRSASPGIRGRRRRAASAGSTSIRGRISRPAIRCTGPACSRTGTSSAPNATRPTCGRTSTPGRARSTRNGARSTSRARRATAPARTTWPGRTGTGTTKRSPRPRASPWRSTNAGA